MARRWGGVLDTTDKVGMIIKNCDLTTRKNREFIINFLDLAKENMYLTINNVDFVKKQLYLNKKNDINQETCGFKHQKCVQ